MSSRTPPRASSPEPRVPRPSTLFRSTTRDALLGRVPPLSARVAASSRLSTGKSRPRRRVAAESRTPSAVAAESRTPGAVAAESRTPGTRRERSIQDDPGRPPPSTRRRRPKPPRTASSMRLPRRFVSLTAPSRRFARLCATGRVVSRRPARRTIARAVGTARDFATPRERGAPRRDAREFDARARRFPPRSPFERTVRSPRRPCPSRRRCGGSAGAGADGAASRSTTRTNFDNADVSSPRRRERARLVSPRGGFAFARRDSIPSASRSRSRPRVPSRRSRTRRTRPHPKTPDRTTRRATSTTPFARARVSSEPPRGAFAPSSRMRSRRR